MGLPCVHTGSGAKYQHYMDARSRHPDGVMVLMCDGPSPGPYRVEITAFRGTGEMVPDGDFPDKLEERQEQYIPARYNTQSDLEVQMLSLGPTCPPPSVGR